MHLQETVLVDNIYIRSIVFIKIYSLLLSQAKYQVRYRFLARTRVVVTD